MKGQQYVDNHAFESKRVGRRPGLPHRRFPLYGPDCRPIEQIREALSDLRQNQSLTPKAIASITKAKNLADIVFSKKVRRDLDQVLGSAHEIAASVGHPGGAGYDFGRDMDVTHALETALQTLIDQMSREAALGG
jgi:hypothetical protein